MAYVQRCMYKHSRIKYLAAWSKNDANAANEAKNVGETVSAHAPPKLCIGVSTRGGCDFFFIITHPVSRSISAVPTVRAHCTARWQLGFIGETNVPFDFWFAPWNVCVKEKEAMLLVLVTCSHTQQIDDDSQNPLWITPHTAQAHKHHAEFSQRDGFPGLPNVTLGHRVNIVKLNHWWLKMQPQTEEQRNSVWHAQQQGISVGWGPVLPQNKSKHVVKMRWQFQASMLLACTGFPPLRSISFCSCEFWGACCATGGRCWEVANFRNEVPI
jgi:hypothetical protein